MTRPFAPPQKEPGGRSYRAPPAKGTSRCSAGVSKEEWIFPAANGKSSLWRRAYLREAQVLILDEPTAALDARAEYEVFERFNELTESKMALFISHRFSTVRMAERIIVLENGCIAEEGSHDQLMALGGRYADMFELQASSYR